MNRTHVRRGAPLLAAAITLWAAPLPGQTPAPAPQIDRDQILATHAEDKGGTAEAGRPLYDKQCAGCHRFGGIGKDVGPDLTTLASRFTRKAALEAILWPSRIISDQYQAEMLELTDGSVVSGVLVRENATAVLIRTGDNPDKPVVIQKARIQNRAPSTVSLMPEGLIEGFSREEISNLLAFVLGPPPEK